MQCNRAIITVVNNIGPTSMPFNEFVLYRAQQNPEEEHYVIALGPVDSDFMQEYGSVEGMNNLKVFDCGGRYFQLCRKINLVLVQLRQQNKAVLIHLHQPRAGIAAEILNLLFLRKVSTLYTVHSMFNGYPFHNKIMAIINFILADQISFISHYAQSVFPGFLRRCRATRIHTIPNGVDLTRVDRIIAESAASGAVPYNRPDFNQCQKGLKLVNIGRLNKQKNQEWLIALMPQIPENVTLTIIGTGPYREKLELMSRELNVLHRVQFAGLLPREKVYRELLDADVFVSSSFWEGLPIAVLEAMALRLPILLSDIGPHMEIAERGESVAALRFDVREWVDRIKSLASMSCTERSSIGQKNRTIVERYFTLKRMHNDYTCLYEAMWDMSRGASKM